MNTYHFDRENDKLTPQVTVNIPIYDSKEAALADIANITDGQIIATREGADEYFAGSLAPVGVGLRYYGTEVPFGYLWENGQEVSRETYADLFSIIGTEYGSGDGSTTFNVPNEPGYIIKAIKPILAS